MARKKGGGGKLNRSEIIQARLDPKLHMAAEIMARSQRRTLSSFIEHSIEQAAKNFEVKRNLFFPWWSEDPSLYAGDKIYTKSDTVSVEKAIQEIGSGHESVRFFKFATYFPDLLNKHEGELFNQIIFTPYFWIHYPVTVENQYGTIIAKEWFRTAIFEGLLQGHLVEYWDKLKNKQITIEELAELPPGKKISHPLPEDRLAIKKFIKTGDKHTPYKSVLVNEEIISCKSMLDDEIWKNYSKDLIAKQLEIKKTPNGSEILATFIVEGEVEEEFIELLKKKAQE